VSLWIGDSLGPVERACLRSVMAQGHDVALYCYRRPKGVPEQVEVRDAAEILPERSIFLHRNGSVGIFADWFRYELQRRSLGTWIDLDNYFIAPIDMQRPYLFGQQIDVNRPFLLSGKRPGEIAIGVLRIPADSPLLPPLLEQFEERRTPDWVPWYHRIASQVREAVLGEADLTRLPWGTTGPYALTALARRFGLSGEASPPEVFNPVCWREADWILDPRRSIDDVVTERTVGVHLWNACIRHFKNKPAPEGSFLERLQREGGE
jgi:hypothetical protein